MCRQSETPNTIHCWLFTLTDLGPEFEWTGQFNDKPKETVAEQSVVQG